MGWVVGWKRYAFCGTYPLLTLADLLTESCCLPKYEIPGSEIVLPAIPMTDTVENLILDLLEWVRQKERTYQETMDAWRTSCPKLPVWERAKDRGLVETGLGEWLFYCPQQAARLQRHQRWS